MNTYSKKSNNEKDTKARRPSVAGLAKIDPAILLGLSTGTYEDQGIKAAS